MTAGLIVTMSHLKALWTALTKIQSAGDPTQKPIIVLMENLLMVNVIALMMEVTMKLRPNAVGTLVANELGIN